MMHQLCESKSAPADFRRADCILLNDDLVVLILVLDKLTAAVAISQSATNEQSNVHAGGTTGDDSID